MAAAAASVIAAIDLRRRLHCCHWRATRDEIAEIVPVMLVSLLVVVVIVVVVVVFAVLHAWYLTRNVEKKNTN